MRVSVSLRVQGLNVDRDVVSATLGVDATHFHKAGDARVGSSGRLYAPFIRDLWGFESCNELPGEVTEQIRVLLAHIDCDGVLRLAKSGHVIDVFVGVFLDEELGGISLPPALMQQLSDLDLTLEVSLYP